MVASRRGRHRVLTLASHREPFFFHLGMVASRYGSISRPLPSASHFTLPRNSIPFQNCSAQYRVILLLKPSPETTRNIHFGNGNAQFGAGNTYFRTENAHLEATYDCVGTRDAHFDTGNAHFSFRRQQCLSWCHNCSFWTP